jgi:S-DNA-T family DNA segregation ATPase FtsK/SpoIIIE
VALALYGILRLYRRVEAWELLNRRTLAVSLLGFAVLLAASCALEAMRLHSLHAELPGRPGGVLGLILADVIERGLGFSGGTLLLIAVMAGAISLFTGLSWLRLSEIVGAAL